MLFMWVSSLTGNVKEDTSICHTHTHTHTHRWCFQKSGCTTVKCFLYSKMIQNLIRVISLSAYPLHTLFCFSCIAAVNSSNRSCGKTGTVQTVIFNVSITFPATELWVYETKGLGHALLPWQLPKPICYDLQDRNSNRIAKSSTVIIITQFISKSDSCKVSVLKLVVWFLQRHSNRLIFVLIA